MKDAFKKNSAEVIAATAGQTARLQLIIHGAVQGVGFRPFVYRLAAELHLAGWVNNTPRGVHIEIEGPKGELNDFLLRCEKEKPPIAVIESIESSLLDPIGYDHFEIRTSELTGQKSALILPDSGAILSRRTSTKPTVFSTMRRNSG